MPSKDKAGRVEGCDSRSGSDTDAKSRSSNSAAFVKRQDRGEVRESVKESVKRSAKKNAAVWGKLSKY